MSLLNAWITPEEALVAVDTGGLRLDGSGASMNKLFTLPYLPAVLGFRGLNVFSAAVFHACASRSLGSFDDLLEALPDITERAAALLPGFQVHGYDIHNEFIAVGWSPSRSTMFARTYVKGGDGFTATDSHGCIAPFDAASMAHLPNTSDAVCEIADAQVKWMRETCGPCGGTLILCRVTRSTIELRHEMKFEPAEATA